jgi:hypothetical protein
MLVLVAAAETDPELVEAARAEADALFDGWFTSHDDAPVDPAWAPQTAASLGDEIRALAGRSPGTRLVDIDCRTRSCAATIEFPSYGAAMTGHTDYVTHFYATRCATAAELGAAEDPASAYRVRVLFHDCT